MKRRHILALALAGALGLAAAPEPDDPPLCRDALAAHPDASALKALDAEEKLRAAEARNAARQARKLMRSSLGAGAEIRALLPAYESQMQRQDEAKRQGKVLCLCRERRGDPHRADCELLYPVVIR